MKTTTEILSEMKKRAEAATEGPYIVERFDHSDGSIAYEVNDDNHLVAFYEHNFDKPMKAKFNAELYAHSRTDLPRLIAALEEAFQYMVCVCGKCTECEVIRRITAILNGENER